MSITPTPARAVTLLAPLVFGSLFVAACGGSGAEPGEVATATLLAPYDRLYSSDSPFSRKLSTSVEVDPDSDRMIESLKSSYDEGGFLIAQKKWTVSVYYADAGTPRHDVAVTADWAPVQVMRGVPIPDGAQPDPEDDGEMAIIDLSTGCEYDFWQARQTDGEWSASWMNGISVDGDGVYPMGLSARGSGFALLAGMIWPDELEAGVIDHALVFSYDYPRAGGPVPPATESDGVSERDDAIPEGARLQLDPDLDLESLNLTPIERTVARALQEYGMILADIGGGIELEMVHPMSFGKTHHEILPDEDYIYFDNIPIDRMRVLKLPPQISDPDIELVSAPGCFE